MTQVQDTTGAATRPPQGGRRCACGCGASLADLRSDALYASEACSKRARRAGRPDKDRTEHPLADARAAQEATELKSHWSQVIHQGIIERLKAGPVHADDLEPLFPANEEERVMCRKLVGAQFGSLASRHYIFEKERRKSSVPSRKGAKSGVFEFTQKGRERLAGVGADGEKRLSTRGVRNQPAVSADSGETPAGESSANGEGIAGTHRAGTLDRPGPSSCRAQPLGAPSSSAALPGGTPQGDPGALTGSAGEPRPSCEPVPLFEEEQQALNPLADAEAA